MSFIILACIAGGWALSRPLIRATRRAESARLIVRRGDYLRTRRASSVARGTFGVRL